MNLVLIGGDSNKFNTYLNTSDPCFGKSYARTSEVCKECRAPVVVDGKLLLLSDVCRAKTEAAKGLETNGISTVPNPARIKRIPYHDVLHRVQAGRTAMEIFNEILGEGSFEAEGKIARQYLYDAVYYLRNKYGSDILTIPPLKDLNPFLQANNAGESTRAHSN